MGRINGSRRWTDWSLSGWEIVNVFTVCTVICWPAWVFICTQTQSIFLFWQSDFSLSVFLYVFLSQMSWKLSLFLHFSLKLSNCSKLASSMVSSKQRAFMSRYTGCEAPDSWLFISPSFSWVKRTSKERPDCVKQVWSHQGQVAAENDVEFGEGSIWETEKDLLHSVCHIWHNCVFVFWNGFKLNL